jgi:hypothetical protein
MLNKSQLKQAQPKTKLCHTQGLVIAIDTVVTPYDVPLSTFDFALIGNDINVLGFIAQEISHDLVDNRIETAADNSDRELIGTTIVVESRKSGINLTV